MVAWKRLMLKPYIYIKRLYFNVKLNVADDNFESLNLRWNGQYEAVWRDLIKLANGKGGLNSIDYLWRQTSVLRKISKKQTICQ